MPEPQISVLIPCYNAEKFVEESFKTILDGSFRDLEIVAVNDASTDRTGDILDGLSDARIRTIHLPKNMGPAGALNAGLAECRGRYVARMDADDLAVADRLERQWNHMEQNPGIGVLAGYAQLMGAQTGLWKTFQRPDELRAALTFGCAICHPTVMLRFDEAARKQIHYNPERTRCEDYDLWVRLSERTQIACLPQVLLQYRIHDSQITSGRDMALDGELDPIFSRALTALRISTDNIQWEPHRLVASRAKVPNEQVKEVENWLLYLAAQNELSGTHPAAAFRKVLAFKWFETCRRAADVRHGLIQCAKSPLLRWHPGVLLRVGRSLALAGGSH